MKEAETKQKSYSDLVESFRRLCRIDQKNDNWYHSVLIKLVRRNDYLQILNVAEVPISDLIAFLNEAINFKLTIEPFRYEDGKEFKTWIPEPNIKDKIKQKVRKFKAVLLPPWWKKKELEKIVKQEQGYYITELKNLYKELLKLKIESTIQKGKPFLNKKAWIEILNILLKENHNYPLIQKMLSDIYNIKTSTLEKMKQRFERQQNK